MFALTGKLIIKDSFVYYKTSVVTCIPCSRH